MALSDESRKDVAASSSYTMEEVAEADTRLEQAVQGRLQDHFKSSRLSAGHDYWLLEENLDSPSVWLAFNLFELNDELTQADEEIDHDLLVRLAYAYLDVFQDFDRTIAVPGPVARSYKDPFFIPIRVRFPEEWINGEYHTVQRFEELLYRYEMSPAEALDYWAVAHMGQEIEDWATIRDVVREAVRKNVRQAKAKLEDEELGASHESGVFRVKSVDDVPEGDPHDPDEDIFYVPTAESLEDDHFED